MSESLDKLTYTAKLATDILLVKNGVGTSMGALAGVILDGAVSGASPFLAAASSLKQSGVSLGHWMALGVFGFNIRTWMKRDDIDPKIKEALLFIEDQVRQGRITRAQAKLRYAELVTKVVESVRLEADTADRLKKLAE
jgi:hypothetical protein